MSLLKHISNFLIEKVLPIKFKVWLLDRLACDIANQGEDGDTELAHINSYEAKLLRSVGGSGTLNSKTGLRQYGGGGKSAPAPASTSTVVEKAEFPPELRPFITDILEKAQAQEQARLAAGYPVFPGPRIAQFTPEERAAQAGIVSLVGSQEPTFDIAKGLTAAGTGAATAETIGERMSPYMQQVVDIEKREAERAAERARQGLAAQAVGSRAFGGSREALMQSELERNLQQQLGDIQTRGQQAAFQQAQQAFEQQKQRQLAGGQQMAGMAPIQSGVQFKELGALAGIGEQQRQQQQKALDLAFQQFREEQTYPEASLQQYQSIIRGFPLQPTTTQTQQSILPTPSLGQQLIGMGTGALGLAGAAKTLFKEGGPLKQIPEENKGLKALAKESPNTVEKMGFKPLKKGKRPKITKKQNQMYKEMLYAMLSDGKRKDMNGDISKIADIMKEKGIATLSQDGGVVKLQSGKDLFSTIENPYKTSMEKQLQRLEGVDLRPDAFKALRDLYEKQSELYDRTPEEIEKERIERETATKLDAYIKLAQLGGDVLAADPSRGTVAAIGQAVSKAAPGFLETAKEYQGIGKAQREEERKLAKDKAAIEAAKLGLDVQQLEIEKGLAKDILGAQKDVATVDATLKSTMFEALKNSGLTYNQKINAVDKLSSDFFKEARNYLGYTVDEDGNLKGILGQAKGVEDDVYRLAAKAGKLATDKLAKGETPNATELFQEALTGFQVTPTGQKDDDKENEKIKKDKKITTRISND